MQLLLKKDVKHLGKRGQVVNVATGYGRNFLLPRGVAVPVNPDNMKMIEAERKRSDAAEAKRRAGLVEIAEAVGKLSITIQARANEEGHLFGSVGPDEIAAAVKDEGFEVHAGMIALEKPVKELGVFEVDIRLDPEVVSRVKVWVVGE
jgi:large subunit ribosomal protein L9